jgi:hypothetical protein
MQRKSRLPAVHQIDQMLLAVCHEPLTRMLARRMRPTPSGALGPAGGGSLEVVQACTHRACSWTIVQTARQLQLVMQGLQS